MPVEVTEEDIARARTVDPFNVEAMVQQGRGASHWIAMVLAEHRVATQQALAEHAGKLVVAYHMAICSPKGVVPNDEFYDPAMAAELERRLGDAIRAGSTGDKG